MEVSNQQLMFRWHNDDEFELLEADVLISHDDSHYRILGSLSLLEYGKLLTGYMYAHNLACNRPEPGIVGLVAYERVIKKINAFVKGRKDVVLSENDFDFITLEKQFTFTSTLQKESISKFNLESHIRPTLLLWLNKVVNHGFYNDVMLIEKVDVEF